MQLDTGSRLDARHYATKPRHESHDQCLAFHKLGRVESKSALLCRPLFFNTTNQRVYGVDGQRLFPDGMAKPLPT